MAYDPDPSLDGFADCPGSKYAGADFEIDGRHLMYFVNFPGSMTLNGAIEEAARELPQDARAESRTIGHDCAELIFHSDQLEGLKTPALSDGRVLVTVQRSKTGRLNALLASQTLLGATASSCR